MRRLGSALVALLVAALVAVLVAGCGGSNPKPSPVSEAPSASASLSESVSPSGAPTMPAEAEGTTPESAEAFVRYYFAEYSYSARTGKVAGLTALSTPECESCKKVVALIDKTYSDGGSATGKGYAVRSLSRTQVDSNSASLHGTVVQYAQHLVPSAGASPRDFPRGSFRARFDLVAVNGRWQLTGWFVL